MAASKLIIALAVPPLRIDAVKKINRDAKAPPGTLPTSALSEIHDVASAQVDPKRRLADGWLKPMLEPDTVVKALVGMTFPAAEGVIAEKSGLSKVRRLVIEAPC